MNKNSEIILYIHVAILLIETSHNVTSNDLIQHFFSSPSNVSAARAQKV